jgi:sulfopyruvate decarboxylase TPP-binding subunit
LQAWAVGREMLPAAKLRQVLEMLERVEELIHLDLLAERNGRNGVCAIILLYF